MRDDRKEQKGITLIALVITIIVLIILAAVGIAMIMGDNGLIDNAQWSKNAETFGAVDEAIRLYITDYRMQKYGSNQELLLTKVAQTVEKEIVKDQALRIAKEGENPQYPVTELRLAPIDMSDTLINAICHEENLTDADMYKEEKVKLMFLDLELLKPYLGDKINQIDKNEFVYNVAGETLYWKDGKKHNGNIYHTLRYGQASRGNTEDEEEATYKIHYSSGYDDEKKEQDIPKESLTIKLKAIKELGFKQDGKVFVYWKDVTEQKQEEINTNVDSVIQTGEYYNIINRLSGIIENWESDIKGIMEENEGYQPREGQINVPQNEKEKNIEDIVEYLEEKQQEINELMSSLNESKTLNELAEWMVANTKYLEKLEEYEDSGALIEDELDEEDIEEDVEYEITYKDESEIEVEEGDIYLEAVWGDEITLKANGGNIDGNESITIGMVPDTAFGSLLKIPTRDGYIFKGWYTEQEGGEQYSSRSIYTEENLPNRILYAQWGDKDTEMVKITFDANGGTCDVPYIYVAKGLLWNDALFPTAPDQVKNGDMIFDSWNDDNRELGKVKVGTHSYYYQGTLYTSDVTCAVFDKDCTLVAHWRRRYGVKFVIDDRYWTKGYYKNHFDSRTGDVWVSLAEEMYKVQMRENGKYTMKYDWWDRENWDWPKWYSTSWDYSYAGMRLGHKMPCPWQVGSSKSWTRGLRATRGIMTNPSTGVKEKFGGWYTGPDGTGQKINRYTKFVESEEDIKDDNGKLLVSTKNTIILGEVWNYQENLGYTGVRDAYEVLAFPHLKERKVITYNANKGSFSKNKNEVKRNTWEGSRYPYVKPKRDGYTFDGWYDAQEGGNRILTRDKNYLVSGDTTLYAHWIPDTPFNISISGKSSNKFTIQRSPAIKQVKYQVFDESGNKVLDDVDKRALTNLKQHHTYTVNAFAFNYETNAYDIPASNNGLKVTTDGEANILKWCQNNNKSIEQYGFRVARYNNESKYNRDGSTSEGFGGGHATGAGEWYWRMTLDGSYFSTRSSVSITWDMRKTISSGKKATSGFGAKIVYSDGTEDPVGYGEKTSYSEQTNVSRTLSIKRYKTVDHLEIFAERKGRGIPIKFGLCYIDCV